MACSVALVFESGVVYPSAFDPHKCQEREPVPDAYLPKCITPRAPILRQRGTDRQRVIEADQSIEDLVRDRQAIDVADACGVERGRVIAEWSAVRPGRGGPRLGFVLSDCQHCKREGTREEGTDDEQMGRNRPLCSAGVAGAPTAHGCAGQFG